MTLSKPMLIGVGSVMIIAVVGLSGFGGYNYLSGIWKKTLDAYKQSIDDTYRTAFEKKQQEIDKLAKQVTDLKKTNNKLKAEMGVLYGEIDTLNGIIAKMKPPDNITQAKELLEKLGYTVTTR